MADNLVKKYNGRLVVKSFSFYVEKGEVVVILGPNGSGKTTSFYMIYGIVKPDSGNVLLNNRDITYLPVHERSGVGICYLPQEYSIFQQLTVQNNLVASLELNGNHQNHKALASDLLDKFKLGHLKNSLAMSLSGGEKRRLEIARLISKEPEYILLDEPFAGVDPISTGNIAEIIKDLSKQNIGVIVTDHNVREALKIADRVYVIHDGILIAHGTKEAILDNELVRNAYLGSDFKV